MIPPLEPSESPESTMEKWKVWADGAYRVGGSGIGILLQSQTEIRLRYAEKLAFNTTNNVAEYEDVIMTLKIIKELGIHKSNIFSDSQLIVNQCQGQFKVREPNLVKYEKKIHSLMERIKDRQGNCELHQVARGDNKDKERWDCLLKKRLRRIH
ncbi:uncharacterized protein Mb2253c-like [Manihot esculenta]|uniref:uncharacterized protein Mb2253c-like n=1 Tax=Manihot esculenta TaxID=3983 RepID=UPI000B5D883B|nr:uncharacterized protein Mb2253c-like [Manihot esculenta]